MKGKLRGLMAAALVILAMAICGCGGTKGMETQPVTPTDTPTVIDGRDQQPTTAATGSLSFKLTVTDPAVGSPKQAAKAAAATVVSGGDGGVAINYPSEYRKRVDDIIVTLHEKATGEWKYSFPFKVVNGEVVAKMEGLIPNAYTITVEAGVTNCQLWMIFFYGQGEGDVRANKEETVRVILETKDVIAAQFRIDCLPEAFDRNAPLNVKWSNSDEHGNAYPGESLGWFEDNSYHFGAMILAYPDPATTMSYSLTGTNGKIYTQTFGIDILSLIDNAKSGDGWHPVTYNPNSGLNIGIVWPDQIKWSDLFQSATNLATGSWPEAVAIADIFGHNDIAMVTSYYGDSANNQKLLIYSSTGNTSYDLGGAGYSVAVGDLNGDGKNDIAVAVRGAGIKLFYNNGTGNQFDAYLLETGEDLKVRLADLNNDGRLDIICIGWGTDKADIFMQGAPGSNGQGFSGTGPFSKSTLSVNHDGYDDLAIGDVNDDGLKDIVIMSGQGMAGGANIMLQTATGFAAPIHQQINSSHGVAIGDIDKDGTNEVVVSSGGNVPDSMISVIKIYPDGGAWAYTLPSSHIPSAIRIADINGDSRNDIIVLHDGWGSVGTYLQKPDGSLKEEQLYGAYAYQFNPDAMAVGDVNNDGKADVVTLDHNYGLGTLYGK